MRPTSLTKKMTSFFPGVSEAQSTNQSQNLTLLQFSLEELKKVGLSLGQAVKFHVPVDPRRKTAHEENVGVLKAFLDQKRETAKPKSKPKRPEKKPERKSKS